MKKIGISMLIVACALAATPAFAQTSTTTATTSPAVNAYITQLQNLRQLQQGMTGEDVKMLQAYLATQPDIYPGGQITGYYGPLTTKAVAKLQKKMGLPAVGRVGPATLAALKNNLGSLDITLQTQNGLTVACAKIPPGHLIAPGQLKKLGQLPVAPTCQKLPPGIAAKLGMGTGTTTGTTTPPAIVAPIISNVVATSTATTTALITWNTNVSTTGKVWYSTTSPVTASSSSIMSTTLNGMNHSVVIPNLTASTTYYYTISATNSSNVSTSTSQQSFMTRSQ
ncbi:MAG: peptidoglycan-binding protein [Patescibacteria group bacterium]